MDKTVRIATYDASTEFSYCQLEIFSTTGIIKKVKNKIPTI